MDKLLSSIKKKRNELQELKGDKKWLKRSDEFEKRKLEVQEQINKQNQIKKKLIDNNFKKIEEFYETNENININNKIKDIPIEEIIKRLRKLRQPILYFGETHNQRCKRLFEQESDIVDLESNQNIYVDTIMGRNNYLISKYINKNQLQIDFFNDFTGLKEDTKHYNTHFAAPRKGAKNTLLLLPERELILPLWNVPLERELILQPRNVLLLIVLLLKKILVPKLLHLKYLLDLLVLGSNPTPVLLILRVLIVLLPVDQSPIYKWISMKLNEMEEEMMKKKLELIKEGKEFEIKKNEATLVQTKKDIKPLLKLIKLNKLDEEILEKMYNIIISCDEGNYKKAYDIYMLLAIGNAAWPMGVTMVGIHERAGRSKIYTSEVAHILNDETTRKYIQMFKRLITFSQNKFLNQNN
ncbi:pre-mRNA splicing protein (Prp18) [Theileria annulata]|uniref:Pre-mRNA-splicing factor 18 n=1 Tax=Theileria annulata TaxID=5874 RepID=Q4UJ31_THEAN|nr:pre-mRNA splicing protein (Prp18) [Theileria annulata]CAI72908.1 pre-mRNA splicing protein (Prp18 homologue), putative [Theileria annulata]|eukprot:XP_953586.1 pre-mRNA splicing protein (Prp18 homologue), putative [Theileria annulata]